MSYFKQPILIVFILLFGVSTFSFSEINEGIVQDNQIWNYYWTIISKVDRGIDFKKKNDKVVKASFKNVGVEFANKGTRNSDFSLVNEYNEDDVFHLIEITKKIA